MTKKFTNSNEPEKIDQEAINKPEIRKELSYNSHFWFFHTYLSSYVKYETATFQREMFMITEDQSIKMAIFVAFRNSAKSTIMTLSYPIWAILGCQQKKFVVILSQTQPQARLHLANIKRELEGNEVLRSDLGPFHEESDEWGSVSLVIPKYNARITAASSEQSIRGMRHGANRPDLIIADDVEDLSSVKTKESRDKNFNWFTGEVIPAGDQDTKIIAIGNLLHEDSLLMRLRSMIEEGKLSGLYREYPLIDDKGRIQWLGKFPSMEAIEELRKSIGNESAWQREFLLRIIPDFEQIVFPEWIQYYEELPQTEPINGYRYTATGIDLAISQKTSADYTAMVSVRVYGSGDQMRAYILPNPINRRMKFPETKETAKRLSETLSTNSCKTELFIEDVGYQSSLVQQLVIEGYPAEGVKVAGVEKSVRLTLVTYLIQNGQVLFPKQGCENLINQLIHFGVEKHDDLADAFALLLLKVIEKNKSNNFGGWIEYMKWEDLRNRGLL